MTVSVLNINSAAPAQYIAAVRQLQLKVNQAGGYRLNVSSVIMEGPEAVMEHIDRATGGHDIPQSYIERVCHLYDALMQEVCNELENEANAA